MLPLVLGSIALAAVGYGVKEYCETEGCPWDEAQEAKASKPLENTFTKIEREKKKLHEELQLHFKQHLLAIEHKKKWKLQESTTVSYETLSQSNIPEDVTLYAKQYVALLEETSQKVNFCLELLVRLKEKNKPYKSFTKEEKQLLKNGYKLFNLSSEMLTLQLLDDDSLNVEAIAPLKTLRKELDTVTINE